MARPLHQAKADFFRTLGHPARIRILELLSERDHAVHELLERDRDRARATSPSSWRSCVAPVSSTSDGRPVRSSTPSPSQASATCSRPPGAFCCS